MIGSQRTRPFAAARPDPSLRIADDAKEDEVQRALRQRRKWDSFHIATAQFYNCSDLYAADAGLLSRGQQLGIKNMDFSKPEPRKLSLFGSRTTGGDITLTP
jgi:hypothetical protein